MCRLLYGVFCPESEKDKIKRPEWPQASVAWRAEMFFVKSFTLFAESVFSCDPGESGES